MDNQHRKISGYRELSEEEIELMNEIKSFGPQLKRLIAKIERRLSEQHQHEALDGTPDIDHWFAAEPERWLETGRTNLQQGLMALSRAVAQPTFF